MPIPEPPMDDPSLLRRGTFVGPWQVGELLGEGATSRVYLVSRSGVQAALKVLKIRSPGQAARLEREARLLREVRHPNIVASYETIDVDGLLGLVMEYIPGPTLADYLRRGRMSLDEATLFGSQLIQGIAAAHRAGLVHRDLKPANVLVDDRTASLTLKITDFGLARALGDDSSNHRTPTVGMLGTPQYLAPEQLKNASSADARADLFSLGAILYEMVVGQPAFDGDLLAVLNASAVGSFRRPSELVLGIPGAVETAIVSALEPDRRFRVPDADTLLQLWNGTATSWDMPAGFPSLEIASAPAPTASFVPRTPAPAPAAVASRPAGAGWLVAGMLGGAALLSVGCGAGTGAVWWFSRPEAAPAGDVGAAAASAPEPVAPQVVATPEVAAAAPAPPPPGIADAEPAPVPAPAPAAPEPAAREPSESRVSGEPAPPEPVPAPAPPRPEPHRAPKTEAPKGPSDLKSPWE